MREFHYGIHWEALADGPLMDQRRVVLGLSVSLRCTVRNTGSKTPQIYGQLPMIETGGSLFRVLGTIKISSQVFTPFKLELSFSHICARTPTKLFRARPWRRSPNREFRFPSSFSYISFYSFTWTNGPNYHSLVPQSEELALSKSAVHIFGVGFWGPEGPMKV